MTSALLALLFVAPSQAGTEDPVAAPAADGASEAEMKSKEMASEETPAVDPAAGPEYEFGELPEVAIQWGKKPSKRDGFVHVRGFSDGYFFLILDKGKPREREQVVPFSGFYGIKDRVKRLWSFVPSEDSYEDLVKATFENVYVRRQQGVVDTTPEPEPAPEPAPTAETIAENTPDQAPAPPQTPANPVEAPEVVEEGADPLANIPDMWKYIAAGVAVVIIILFLKK